jgi:transcription elongation factor SPT6
LEIKTRYGDLRTPYHPPEDFALFNLLTKESPETFDVGRVVMAKVVVYIFESLFFIITIVQVLYIRYQKAQQHMDDNDADEPHPIRDEVTGRWQCSQCKRRTFTEPKEVCYYFCICKCRCVFRYTIILHFHVPAKSLVLCVVLRMVLRDT